MKENRFNNLSLHAIGWAIFVSWDILSRGSQSGVFTNIWDYAGHYLLNIFLFYFNAHVVLPGTLTGNRKSYFLLICLLLFEISFYVAAKYALLCIYSALNIPTIPIFT